MAGPGDRSRRESAPWVAPEGVRGEVQCPLCGAINSAAAPFCRWCGTPRGRPTDPVLGITTRRSLEPHHGSLGGTVLGAIAAVAILALAAWLVLGGGLGTVGSLVGQNDPTPTRTPAATEPIVATDPPTGSSEPSLGVPSAPPTQEPSVPAPTGEPTVLPSVEPSPSASAAETGFTCEPATITDASSAGWTLTRARWGPRGNFDQLGLVLELRRASAPRATVVTVESMEVAEVSAAFGIEGPASSERAIVLTFDGPTDLTAEFTATPALSVIQALRVQIGSDGLLHAVIGVAGRGCHRLSAPSWAFESPAQEIEVILDVRPQ